MWLSRVTVHNCRIITQAELELAAQANVVYGGNASGKSSLLEALTLLARGRSFRTPRIAEVLQRGAEELTVSATVEHGVGGGRYPLGISKTAQATRIRINHADIAQQAELSSHLPLTLMHPGSVELLTGSPSLRRAFLDWIAFYRFADFHKVWRDYQRILRQRNACLRDLKQRYALAQWTTQFIALQPLLHSYRSQALTALQTDLQISHALLASTGMPHFSLSSGFPAQVDIAEPAQLQRFFHDKQAQELKQGFSLYGAHRADLQIALDGIPAVRIASRGQLKLLAVSLLLAQSHAAASDSQKRGIILIDDLAAELDEANLQALYNTLCTTQQQLVITGTHLEPLRQHFSHARVFHVERGQVTCC